MNDAVGVQKIDKEKEREADNQNYNANVVILDSFGSNFSDREEINILICTNEHFLQHAATCLASLLFNNSKLFFNICVASLNTEIISAEKLRLSLKKFRNFKLTIKSLRSEFITTLPLNVRTHYTSDIWTRLWAHVLFGPDVSRVLYLDCDIIVVGNIQPLWETALDNFLLAAVDIPGSTRGIENLNLRKEDRYFNSGVMLINLEQWRNVDALGTVLAYVAKNIDRLRDPDQDALNACFYSCWKCLDYKWNATSPFFFGPSTLPLSASEIKAVRRHVCIIHFNGWLKPWYYVCNHPRKYEYSKYIKMTAWANYRPPDKTLRNILIGVANVILPRRLRRGLKKIAKLN